MTVHVLNYNSSFSIDTGIFSFIIFKRLYHTSFKLNIVNLSRALSSGPPLKPLRGSQCFHAPQELFISQSMQNAIFFFPTQGINQKVFLGPVSSKLGNSHACKCNQNMFFSLKVTKLETGILMSSFKKIIVFFETKRF